MTFSPNRKVASNQIRGFNKMVEHQKWNNLIEGDKNTRLDRVNQRQAVVKRAPPYLKLF